MNDQKMLTRAFAVFSFLFSLVIYTMTMAPTVSFWDCGEFIACSYRLAVPHPPGAPLYLLVGRVFTLIPDFLIEDIAKRVNLISVLSSAFTILFLHLTIVHLIREYLKETDGFFRYVPHVSATIGALCFAFSHSFWFNAVEAEVYAPSMLFTSLSVWLIFKWSEISEEAGNEKYLLLIAYLVGLAIGVHLLNILTLPMIFMIIYYKRFEINATSFFLLVLVGGAITGFVYEMVVLIPEAIEIFDFGGLLVILLISLMILGFAIRNGHKVLSIALTCILLITVGYSSYMMIYIRSGLDPNIDENDPETVEAFISYLKREQYGEHHLSRTKQWKDSPNGNNYSSAFEFFWKYQVYEMYVRYFLWNFGGIEDTQDFSRERKRADPWQLWWLPLIIGMLGISHHFQRDWKHGLAIFALFFMTGLAIIIYLNQPDPQPRERDYSYVGSFFAFAIWVGIGASAILEWLTRTLREKQPQMANSLPWLAALLIFFATPMRMLALNYHEHDRTGNFVARDYSRNMLISSDEGGIMFTNGDNDTFPLWYLQEVEEFRTDVRVANLSLLNTSWYIEQLKNKEPKVPISFSDQEIDNLIYPVPWAQEKTIEVTAIDPAMRKLEAERYRLNLEQTVSNIPDKVSFKVRPKMQIPGRGGALRIQDWMILNILITNQFERPMYFAVTTSDQNRLDGLREYQRMDGLLFRITTIPGWSIDPETLYDNLVNKFYYTNLNNPDVYFNENIIGLLQNYRSAFFRLATHYLETGNRQRFEEVIQKLYEVMPPEVIPFTNQPFEEAMTVLASMAKVYPEKALTIENYSLRQLQTFGEFGYNFKDYQTALAGYHGLLQELESNPQGPAVRDYMRSMTRNPRQFDLASEVQKQQVLQSAISQARRQLVNIYKTAEDYAGGIAFLEAWQEKAPNDGFVKRQLEEFRKLKDAPVTED